MKSPAVRQTPSRRAFTLIELIIVIAVTAVLFSLLIIPLVSALRYNQQAQSVTAAQDAARTARERLVRELGSAAFVFDGTSHPFKTAQINPGDDRYTNFLDLQIPGITPGTTTYAPTIAHAYNAKLDFVMARANDTGVTDPTTGASVSYRQSDSGSAIVSSPALVFPPAPGTTMVREWVGLKNPDVDYTNTRERLGTGNTDNTYILYRAQFQPYKTVTDASGKKSVALNDALFAAGTVNPALPELDDPDFFRTVTANKDVNWLNDSHNTYSSGEANAHNARLANWVSLAKPVIPGPNVDLIALPHNADNTLAYDSANGQIPGVAHSGAANDPVTSHLYPIVNTTVTFRPGTVSGDATPGTTAEYTSQGAAAADVNGFVYVPTVYTTTNKSWSLPYHVSVYPANYDAADTADDRGVFYDTQTAPQGQTITTPGGALTVLAGDILEYRHVGGADTNGTLVYDVTQGFPVTVSAGAGGGAAAYTAGGKNYLPMAVSPDTGTISFNVPSLPQGPATPAGGQSNRYVREWHYSLTSVGTDGTLDLTQPTGGADPLTDSPLATTYTSGDAAAPSPATGVPNAHLVPGSVRVSGPDQTPGPGAGLKVPYQEVQPFSSASDTQVRDNQFSVDYAKGLLRLKSGVVDPSALGIAVIYEYQANMTLTTPTDASGNPAALSGANPYQPMQVKVDYQTRDLIDVSLGVRIYDVSTGRAQVLPSDTRIKIGNSNR